MNLFRYVASGLLCLTLAADPAQAAPQHWVAAWAAAPDQEGPPISAKTIRQIVRPSIGGSSVRLRLSNLYGTGPMTIGPVRVAKDAGESAIQPGTDRAVTFNGKPTATIAQGADVSE